MNIYGGWHDINSDLKKIMVHRYQFCYNKYNATTIILLPIIHTYMYDVCTYLFSSPFSSSSNDLNAITLKNTTYIHT